MKRIGLALVFFSLVVIPHAEALQVKQIQSGICNFYGNTSSDLTLKPAIKDLTKAVVLITTSQDNQGQNYDQNGFFTAKLLNESTVHIERSGGTSFAAVHWQVIEFVGDGVTVTTPQEVTMGAGSGAGSTTVSVSLVPPASVSSASTANVLPIVYTRGAYANTNKTQELRVLPTLSGSMLTFTRPSASTAITVSYQLLWFDTAYAKVHTGSVNIPSGNTVPVSAPTIVPAVSANAVLFTYSTGESGTAGYDTLIFVRGTLSTIGNATSILLERGGTSTATGNGANIQYYVVDFLDTHTFSQQRTVNWFGTPAYEYGLSSPPPQGNGSAEVSTGTNHSLISDDIVTIGGVLNTGTQGYNGVWTIKTLSSDLRDVWLTLPTYSKISDATSNTTGSGRIGRAVYDGGLSNFTYERSLVLGVSSTAYSTGTGTQASANSLMFNVFPIKNNSFAVSNPWIATTRSPNTSTTYPAKVSFYVTEFGPVSLTAPSTAMSLVKVGDPYTVTWTHADVAANDSWKLEISTDNGSTWGDMPSVCGASYSSLCTGSAINGNPLSVDSVQMKFPDKISSTVKFRIVDTTLAPTDASPNYLRSCDTSINAFQIKPDIIVTSPNGGETWLVGETTRDIQWTYGGAPNDTVSIYLDNYSVSPVTSTTIITGVGKGDVTAWGSGSYTWKPIPDSIGSAYKIRIVAGSGTTLATDSSDNNFSIKGSITVTAPATGAVWHVGENQTIAWTAAGTLSSVKVLYSTDGTEPSTAITGCTALTGTSCAWNNIPASAASNNVKIKVVETTGVSPHDVAGYSSFFPVRGVLTINSPLSSTSWTVNTSGNSISWSSQGPNPGPVNIDYSDDGTFATGHSTPIAGSVSASSYSWTIPANLAVSVFDTGGNPKSTVRISSANTPPTFDPVVSTAFLVKGTVNVLTPGTGTVWNAGASGNSITWTSQGTNLGNLNIDYSDDGSFLPGHVTSVIATGVAVSLGSYPWTVPADISVSSGAQAKIRLKPMSLASIFNAADSNGFTMKGALVITVPNSSTVWGYGTTSNITWTSTGTALGNVNLYYKVGSAGSYTLINTSPVSASAGTYSWTIPDAVSNTVYVKISSAETPQRFDDAVSSSFSVQGSITINTPVSTTVWEIGTVRNITWTDKGNNLGYVNLWYKIGSGTLVPINPPTPQVSASADTYPWTIPDTISDQVTVLIQSNSTPSTFADASSQPFSIKGSVTIILPTASTVWSVGTTQNITWNSAGSNMGNVNLYYKIGSGSYNLINTTTTVAATSGTYPWTIPNTANGDQVTVRISSVSTPSKFSDATQSFVIKGTVGITAPSASSSWTVGSSQNITWSSTGASLGTLNLYYKVGSGNYTLINASPVAVNQGTYPWTVPDAVSSQVTLLLSSASSPPKFADTTQAFAIKGSVTINTPNNSSVWTMGSSQNITWTPVGSSLNFANLYYQIGTGAPVLLNASPIAVSDGSYLWTIPNNMSGGQATVTLSSSSMPPLFDDYTSQTFSIKGSVVFNSPPTASTIWTVGSTHDITWTAKGTNLGSVNLYYKVGTGSYVPINATPILATTGIYPSWTVPDAVSDQVTLKVSSTSTPIAFVDNFSPTFAVKGSLSLTAPATNTAWFVGSSQNITWSRNGTTGNLKIEYSTDGGKTYPNVIAENVASDTLTQPWTIPDAIGDRVRVKLTLNSDSTVFAESPNFTIKGALALTSPTDASAWVVGSSQNIAWTRNGSSMGNAKIEYSMDGGKTYPGTIIGNIATSSLAQAWTIPDAIGSQVRVKITLLSDTMTFSESPNFAIKGQLDVLSPMATDIWAVGSTHTITWDKIGSVGNVNVEYSKFGGTTGSYIAVTNAQGVPASGLSLDWVVPDAVTNQAKIRITPLAAGQADSVESPLFAIKGGVTLTSPLGGEGWVVNESHPITWTKSGSLGHVKIEYSTDGGATYPSSNVIAADIPSDTSSFNWTVPDAIGKKTRVRITLLSDPTVKSESANFTIKGSLKINSPNGGETWTVNSSNPITWTTNGNMGPVKLEYSTTSGSDNYPNTLTPAGGVPATPGSFPWTVPDQIGTHLRVKVTLLSDPSVSDASDADFTIKGSLKINSPNGGETWTVNSSNPITWTTNGSIHYVNLYYTTNSAAVPVVWTPINTGRVPNAPMYDWTVPDTLGSKIKVRIENADDPTVYDESDSNFKIAGHIDLLYPKNGGETWIMGTTANITWTKRGSFPFVKIEYSTDSGSTYNFVAASDATTGSYVWTIPETASAHVRLRISNTDDASVNDVSLADSVIRAGFHFTVPVGGESWPVASSQAIHWTIGGTVSRVDLEYSTDDGATFSSIVTSIANTGSYTWPIPDAISTKARLRVSDSKDPAAADISPSFKIQGVLALTSPRDGDRWSVGSSPTISWNKTGSISQVKLEYRKDVPGAAWNPIAIAPVNAAPSSFQWTLPDNIEDFIEIRVSDAAANDADAFATAKVKVIGQLALTSPAGGERWVAFENHNITWNTKGTVPKVKIEYSSDDFATSTVINAAFDNQGGANGSYAWTIPDPGIQNVPKSVKVRVTDAAEPQSFTISNAFKIDYYDISWDVRDLVTNLPISALTVLEVKNTDASYVQWQEVGVTVSPPRVQPTPYGQWTATWSKSGYGDVSYTVVATQDQSIVLYMESSATHIWRAESQVTYNPVTGVADVGAWLEKDGAIITTATHLEFEVYKGSTLVTTVSASGIDANGFFHTTVPPGTLQVGNTYTTITKIGIVSGAVFKTPSSFEITTPATLQEMKNAIVANLDKPLSQINSELQMTLAAQAQTINQKLDTQTTAISSALGGQTAIIQNTLTSFESKVGDAVVNLASGAKQSLEASKELQKTAAKYSWKASVSPNPAITDGTILLQVQGPIGLLPYVSVYNSENRQIIVNAPLKEDAGKPGIYAFEFKAAASDFPAGKAYTYIVTEDTMGALIAGSGSVESVSLTTIAGLASAGAGAEQAAREAVTAIKDLESSMTHGGDVRKALLNLQTSVNELPTQVAKMQGQDSKKIGNQVKDISDRLQKLAGDQGLDFHGIFKAAIDDSSSIQDIRGRSEAISQSVGILGTVVQKRLGGEDEPIVATTLE